MNEVHFHLFQVNLLFSSSSTLFHRCRSVQAIGRSLIAVYFQPRPILFNNILKILMRVAFDAFVHFKHVTKTIISTVFIECERIFGILIVHVRIAHLAHPLFSGRCFWLSQRRQRHINQKHFLVRRLNDNEWLLFWRYFTHSRQTWRADIMYRWTLLKAWKCRRMCNELAATINESASCRIDILLMRFHFWFHE